tara:strand:+ start:963 stop:1271 length:309 start_codon:yes stop_codon:yes gene_type:complete
MKIIANPMEAIMAINPTAKVAVEADDINQITWLNGTTPIAKADIEAKMAELQTEYDAKQYQRDRAADYPSVKDQLDKIYHEGIDEWKKLIKVTKDKYPKPGA